MDVNKIVQFRLLKSEFRQLEISDSYKLLYLTKENYNQYWDDINIVIELLHADLEWDGIPTKKQVENRFNNNSQLNANYNPIIIIFIAIHFKHNESSLEY